jgi:hypothetical protein
MAQITSTKLGFLLTTPYITPADIRRKLFGLLSWQPMRIVDSVEVTQRRRQSRRERVAGKKEFMRLAKDFF